MEIILQKTQIEDYESRKWNDESEFKLYLAHNETSDNDNQYHIRQPKSETYYKLKKLSNISHKPVIREHNWPFKKFITLMFPFRNVVL